jgi:NAD(P)-dependent dehydrogenase (short-subunit alcohol dehydrogenase family)
MPPHPNGLAILLGAGPTAGAGIARMLASPTHGNLAVALLSRSGDDDSLASSLRSSSGSQHLKAFKTDTSAAQLKSAFGRIKTWNAELGNLKLKIAIWNIKHSHRVDFADETPERFGESLQIYVTGAMAFSQLCTKWMLEQYPDVPEHAMHKMGTLIFTVTLGALRTNPGYAAYGAGRSGVRMLAQSLAREYSAKGIHVVHAIANGGITDAYHDYGHGEKKQEDAEKVLKGAKMRAESVGRLYLTMMEQECDLWCHELDMRPAAERF